MTINSGNSRFKFWCPLDIEKSVVEDGEKKMRMHGIASTIDEDTDGEFLDSKGFDIKPLLKGGHINWNHQSKTSPAAIIGEPVEGTKLTKEGLYIVTDLYPDSKLANDVFELAGVLEKNSKTRRLGYSIEGEILERDPFNKKIITKARITGVAITHKPKNKKTFAEILKGEVDDYEDIEHIGVDSVVILADITKADGSRVVLDSSGKITFVEKAMTTEEGSGKPVMKESLDGALKSNLKKKKKKEEEEEDEESEKAETLEFTKGEVFDKIFSEYSDINFADANRVFKIIQKVSTMANEKKITKDSLRKAEELLGISKAEESAETTILKASDSVKFEGFERGEQTFFTQFIDGQEVGDKLFKAEGDGFTEMSEQEIDLALESIQKSEDDDEDDEEGKVEQEDDDEDDEGEEEDEGKKGKFMKSKKTKKAETDTIEKAEEGGNEILKAITEMNTQNSEMFKAVGTVLSNIKAQQETFQKSMETRLEEIESQPVGRKSVTTQKPIDRFAKAEGSGNGQTLSITENKKAVLDLLDHCTFEKGQVDEGFAQAMSKFESSGIMPGQIIQRLQVEKGITLVQ